MGRADVGSEPSAASGGRSEASEWPRSKFQASAVRQRGNFGHRNRVIGPYANTRSACGRGVEDAAPYGCIIDGAVRGDRGAALHR